MEIKTNTLNEHNIQSTGQVSNMKLDEDSHAMIFQMFTGGLYSDPIGTVIREITSNCFDSHVEAGVDSTTNPVVVELTKEVSGNFIIFKDKGVGMSPDRIENIYGTYFKSTKRKTNDQIGGFGLGGKTPLAYTDSFYIVTRFEGIEYTYNVFEGNNVPAIELMGQQSTDKPNGTDVKVPVKEYDIMEFEQKTLRQLYYFENIVFKGFSDRYVTNEYNIVRGKNFLYRGDDLSEKMHVCYGKVAYPIDYDAMGIDYKEYIIPVAVRIEIGELEGTGVTPSREAIKYTKQNIKTIKTKMDNVLTELKGIISEQHSDVKTLVDYYRAKENFDTIYFTEEHTLYVRNVIKQKDVTFPNFKYDTLIVPQQNEIIPHFYNIKLYGKKYSTKSWKNNEWNKALSSISNYDNIYYNDGVFNRKVIKQSYLRTLVSSENFYVLTPVDLDNKDVMKDLMRKFGATQEIFNDDSTSDNQEWKQIVPKKKAEKLIRTMYKELHKVVKDHTAGSYDAVEVPDSFIEARKQERLSEEMLKTTIPIKCSYYSSRYRVTLKNLQDLKGKIYYGFNDDTYTLDSARHTFSSLTEEGKNRDITATGYDLRHRSSKGTAFFLISKGNEKYMKLLGKKAIHVNYFYQTFVARKIDKIVEGMINKKIKNRFDEYVLPIFKDRNFKFVDEWVHSTAMDISSLISTTNTNYGWNITKMEILNKLGIDIDKIDVKFEMQEELDNLIELSEKNKNRLKWINMPYEIDMTQPDHKELVEMLELMFER